MATTGCLLEMGPGTHTIPNGAPMQRRPWAGIAQLDGQIRNGTPPPMHMRDDQSHGYLGLLGCWRLAVQLWQKPFWTVSGSWRLPMSNGGIGPGLGFQNTSCSLRQCKVCVAFSLCHYMAISVVQFSSYLLSLGRLTYLLVCPCIIEVFHFVKARPLAR